MTSLSQLRRRSRISRRLRQSTWEHAPITVAQARRCRVRPRPSLLNVSRDRREDFNLTLTRYVAERTLYRPGTSAVREKCALNGAMLLTVTLDDLRYRPSAGRVSVRTPESGWHHEQVTEPYERNRSAIRYRSSCVAIAWFTRSTSPADSDPALFDSRFLLTDVNWSAIALDCLRRKVT